MTLDQVFCLVQSFIVNGCILEIMEPSGLLSLNNSVSNSEIS